ncbi:hypothetical protein AB4Y45_34510 [Paraburkholderia sp. EG287A]|uniref:hypothetical protein n=1 Tax=Paraburkholderia sp. EG287A TaxID=3237012 RepID=UPI0034D18C0C
MSNEKSWKEIGATIGAAVDLASYAHSKFNAPSAEATPARSAPPAVVEVENGNPRWLVVGICTVVAALGVAMGIGALLSPSSVHPGVKPVCEFAPAAAQANAASAARVPLNPPCRIPFDDGLTPGERIGGTVAVTAIKAVIFSIL